MIRSSLPLPDWYSPVRLAGGPGCTAAFADLSLHTEAGTRSSVFGIGPDRGRNTSPLARSRDFIRYLLVSSLDGCKS